MLSHPVSARTAVRGLGFEAGVMDIEIDPSNHQVLYVAAQNDAAVYKSTAPAIAAPTQATGH